MDKIRLGILGGGEGSLIGVLHRIASYMYDSYLIVGGCFNSDWDKSIRFAKKISLDTDRVYPNEDKLIEEELKLPKDERMQVVSVLTPNFLHYPMVMKLLENGFHVICEKPLSLTYEEAKKIRELVQEKKAVFAVTYTYTGYPMVREMRHLITSGRLGDLNRIDVQYYQGWINSIIHDKEKRKETWRLDPEKSGISCCIGDIGTHAFDMVEYVTGCNISQILADLNYLYGDNELDVDGTVLLRLSNNAKGVLRASQIATGEENNLRISVYGDKGGLCWEQENPNFLTYFPQNGAKQILTRGQNYNSDLSNDGVKIPSGHPEGIFDSMGNIYHGVARAINGENPDKGAYPTVNDGTRGMDFIEKAVASHKEGNIWKNIDE